MFHGEFFKTFRSAIKEQAIYFFVAVKSKFSSVRGNNISWIYINHSLKKSKIS